jgi:hypothetical protein
MRPTSQQGVATELAALASLPRNDLAVLWEQQFGCRPPKGCGRKLLELAAAYSIQAKMLGDHKSATHRQLTAVARASSASRPNASSVDGRLKIQDRLKLKAGTRLVREWQGRTYHVEVTQRGYFWNGKVHTSLSAIATEITGARWSGRRFFGL